MMNGWSADFKKGFFIGAGVLIALMVIGMVLGALK